MSSPYRSLVSYSRLLNDCWETLQGKRYPVFPNGSRAAPSSVVYVFPNFDQNAGYFWQFWEEIAAPVLASLNADPPPYLGGWDNIASRTTVDAALRAALAASPTWGTKVDYNN